MGLSVLSKRVADRLAGEQRPLEEAGARAADASILAIARSQQGELRSDVTVRDGEDWSVRVEVRGDAALRLVAQASSDRSTIAFDGEGVRALPYVADRMVRAFDAPDDPLDADVYRAAYDLIDAMNLWYGDVSLVAKNFETAESYVATQVASTESMFARPDTLGDAWSALRRLVRTADDPGATAEALARASLNRDARVPMAFDPIDAARAIDRLGEHFRRNNQGGADRMRALLTILSRSGHRFWDLGDRRYAQMGTTSLFVATDRLARVALLEYVGDGP